MKYLIIALVMFFGIFLSLPSSAVPQVRCSAPGNTYPGGSASRYPDLWARCKDGEKPNGGTRWTFECDKHKDECTVELTFLIKKSRFNRTKRNIDVKLELQTAPTDGSASRLLHTERKKVFIDTLSHHKKGKLQRRYVKFEFDYAPLHAHLKGKPPTTEIKAVMEIDPDDTRRKTRWHGTLKEVDLVGKALESNETNNTMTLVTIRLNAEVQ